MLNPRNYRSYRNGNLAIFFWYVCNGKIFKELFAYTLNGISVIVRCIFYACRFMCYIDRLVATHSNKTTRWHAKKPEKTGTVTEVEHRHGSSVASLECTGVTKSIIYIIMRKEKQLFTSYPAAKRPKHSKFAITDMQEKPAFFFVVRYGHRL